MVKWLFEKDKKDADKFKQIYEDNFNYVYSFVFARVGADAKVTEEIVQEVFLIAWQTWSKFSNKSSYSTWFCGIAKNKLYEHYRAESRNSMEQLYEQDSIRELPSDFDMENFIIKNETREEIIEVLKNIKPLYKYCLVLKYIDEYSIKDIAKILDRTPKAIDGMLQRARRSFSEQYLNVAGRKNKNE